MGVFSATSGGATNWGEMLVVVAFLVWEIWDGEGPDREESLCHNGG
jgi:hypothetical protein